jgi:mannose-6-phosphate isomerase-like protein (cupin superfamily)
LREINKLLYDPNWGILKFNHKLKEDLSMNKYTFNDYFHEPEGKIAKRMLFKSDNVIAFVLNIAKREILPGHTHLESTLFLQVMEGNAMVVTNSKETPLQLGELMQVDGQESLQVINTGEDVLRLFVTISPMGSEAFATDANV